MVVLLNEYLIITGNEVSIGFFSKFQCSVISDRMDKKSYTSSDLPQIIYETYQDFAENTSIHGLKYTVKKEISLTEK